MNREEYSKKILEILNIQPMRFGKLKKYFGIKGNWEIDSFKEILRNHELLGNIFFDGTYYRPFPKKFMITTIEVKGANPSSLTACFKASSGMIIPILEENLNGALIGDTVVLDLKNRKVVNVLKRHSNRVICEVIAEDDVKYLVPLRILGKDYLKLRISEKDMKKLIEGDIVSVILDTLKYDEYFEADFEERLGHKNDPDIVLNVIASNHGFSLNYPEEVNLELYTIPTTVSKKECQNRLDLRAQEIFTIDGKYTKDMDDAISLKELSNGHYELGVHIADVSHYIPYGSSLWKEAVKRGTSLYMVNSVIPMIPHQLSNGICSLNEGVDRLTISCMMELNQEGEVLDFKVVPSVIQSKKKMTYEEVESVLNGNVLPEYKPFYPTLLKMAELALKIKKQRASLPFQSGDLEYIVDDKNNVLDFHIKKQDQAMNMIEQFMVMANVCLSKYGTYLGLPIPYRIHEEPIPSKVDKMLQDLHELGFSITDCIHHNQYKTLYAILDKYKDKREFPFLSDVILKTMKKASYSTYNEGHYALQEKYYSHFTSPIRRLPDLLLHYQIKTIFNHTYPRQTIASMNMEMLCEHASFMERQAEAAEKEADQYTILRYISSHPEKFYFGYVEKVEEEKITVVLKSGVKGTILLEQREDLSLHIQNNTVYSGKNIILKVGDSVKLKPAHVDLVRNEIDFCIQKNLSRRQYQDNFAYVLKRGVS